MKKVLSMLMLFVAVLVFTAGCGQTPVVSDPALSPVQEATQSNGGNTTVETPEIPKVSVNVGMAPVGDQTWAYIGMEEGFLKKSALRSLPSRAEA